MQRLYVCLSGLLILLFAQSSFTLQAQDGGKFELGADVYSRYVWRGTDFGNSPSIQPGVTYSKAGFSLGAWGSYSINSNSMQETDLFVSYDVKELISITVTDYFFPNGTSANNKYFDYDEDATGHVFEGMLSFNGLDSFPLSFTAAYNFYGADSDNSVYLEMAYGSQCKDVEYNVFVGAATGNYYLYGKNDDDFGIVNLGISLSKELKITDSFGLPVSGAVITNPTAESIFIVFGFSL